MTREMNLRLKIANLQQNGNLMTYSQKNLESKPKLKKLCKKLLCQVPEKSLKLKQLKVFVDEQCLVLSKYSSKKDALAFLKKKNELKSHICWHVYGLLYR